MIIAATSLLANKFKCVDWSISSDYFQEQQFANKHKDLIEKQKVRELLMDNCMHNYVDH